MSHKRNANKKLHQKKRKGQTSFKPGPRLDFGRLTLSDLKRAAGLL